MAGASVRVNAGRSPALGKRLVLLTDRAIRVDRVLRVLRVLRESAHNPRGLRTGDRLAHRRASRALTFCSDVYPARWMFVSSSFRLLGASSPKKGIGAP